MGGRLRPESVAGINRNGWPLSTGISGRLGPEYAPKKVGGKRMFTEEQIKELLRITEELIRKKILTAANSAMCVTWL